MYNSGILKGFSLCIIILCLSTLIHAIEVDIDVIKKMQKVEFQNYEGPHKKIDKVSQIKGIGRNLAKGIKRHGSNKTVFFNKKYSMVHAFSSRQTNKISADIFSILKKAQVDHIKNIQRILAGYLEEKYNYSTKHAKTLSIFLTFYNAVYHQDMRHFQSVYKDTVLQYINKKYAGLSVNYEEWPGNTKILIPLTLQSKRKELDSIDLDAISDTNVKKSIRDKGENIDERKDLIEMKEKVIERDLEEVDEKVKELLKKKEDLEKDPDSEKAKEEMTKVDEDLKDLEKKKEKIEEKYEAAQKEKEEIRQDELDKKEEDLDKRENILRSEKVDKNIYADKLYYLKVSDHIKGGHYNNQMYIIDTETQEVKVQSPLKNICGTKYDIFSDGVMVISYITNHNSPHRLTLLNLETLKVKKYSKQEVFWRSFVLIKDDFAYVIIIENGKHFLGKFDSNLKLIAKSKETVQGDTFISFIKDRLYINRWDKIIMVLKTDDLSLIDSIEPGAR